MGFFKKLFSYCMTGSWEETKRIELYDKIGEKLDDLPPDKLEKIKKILEENE